MKLRDTKTDLMRLAFMFMICLVHAVGCDTSRWTHWLTNVSYAGVLGFVLISGYYGIRFSWSKVLKLEGVGIGCALTVVSAAALCDPAAFTLPHYAQEVIRLFRGYWFVHAYVALMIFSTLSSPATVLPFILLVYGWSFLAHLPALNRILPLTPGLEPFGGITLFAVYLVGRLYRRHDWDAKLKLRWVLPLTALCGLVVASVIPPTNHWCGVLARYNSPFLLGLALGLFWLLRRLQSPTNPWFVRFLRLLTPSVFSIYLIHTNDYGHAVLAGLEKTLATHGFGGLPAYFIMASAAFFAGVFLDVPRRLVCLVFKVRKPCS